MSRVSRGERGSPLGCRAAQPGAPPRGDPLGEANHRLAARVQPEEERDDEQEQRHGGQQVTDQPGQVHPRQEQGAAADHGERMLPAYLDHCSVKLTQTRCGSVSLPSWAAMAEGSETARKVPVRERIELWSALLLAAATVATAFSAYEATRWGGVQATSFTEGSGARTESAKAESDGFTLVAIDASIFTQYAVAFSQDNERLLRILRERFFREEFLPAYRAWLKQEPLSNPDAAKLPFQLPEYRIARLEEADRLAEKAGRLLEDGREANQTSDEYVLGTIFFAAVLFFAGLATKFNSDRIAVAALGFGSLMFVGGLARLATLPFH